MFEVKNGDVLGMRMPEKRIGVESTGRSGENDLVRNINKGQGGGRDAEYLLPRWGPISADEDGRTCGGREPRP